MTHAEEPGAAPVAVVTGGSRGIGASIVTELARDGYQVAYCYSGDTQAAERLAQELPPEAKCLHRKADVRDSAAVHAFLSEVREVMGEPDLLVVCAGVTRDSPLVLMPDADWHSVIDINLTGAYNFCRAIAFPMMKQRSGSIVLIGSVAGTFGNASQANYSASKAGLEGLGKSLAKELARYGIRVNVVAPGFIETDMTASLDENMRAKVAQEIPVRRFGQVEEVASVVGFLASARASYITGQVIGVNGGADTVNQLEPRWYVSVRSPYSWLALHDAQTTRSALLEACSMRVFFEPESHGEELVDSRSPRFHYTPMSRAKHLYILRDVQRLARDRGLTVTWPRDSLPQWEISSLALAQVLRQDQGAGKRLAYEIAAARWTQGADVHDESVIRSCLLKCGLDGDLAMMYRSKHASELTSSVLSSLDSDGVFGVPMLVIGREPFWGIDRLDAAARELLRRCDMASRPQPADPGGAVPIDDQPGGCG